MDETINQIIQHVAPGSFIVANERARCYSFEALQQLKQYATFSIESLHKFDTSGGKELLRTLGKILFFQIKKIRL